MDTDRPSLSLVGDTGKDKLTSKQEHFAQLVASGERLTDAYRAAYNVGEGTKPSAVWTNASKLATQNAKVALRIKTLSEENAARKRTDDEKLRIWITDRLKHEATQGSDTSRVASLVALGKTCQLFSEHIVTSQKDDRTAHDIEAELQQKLAQFMAD
jgi:phage terminase small subunit